MIKVELVANIVENKNKSKFSGMKKNLNKKNPLDKISIVAYSIVLNVFKRNISTKESKTSKALKYSSLSRSD